MAPSSDIRFEAFTPEHFVLMGSFLVVCLALVVLGRSHRGTLAEVRFRRTYATRNRTDRSLLHGNCEGRNSRGADGGRHVNTGEWRRGR